MSIKNPLPPAGIEPAAFRFVAQHLSHCATAVPHYCVVRTEILYIIRLKLRLVRIICKDTVRTAQ